MGGTNFWGSKKEDDCFLVQSFDDRILEVVAVFGSVQMAASRLINLQHHRIAQCQSVQINILGLLLKASVMTVNDLMYFLFQVRNVFQYRSTEKRGCSLQE